VVFFCSYKPGGTTIETKWEICNMYKDYVTTQEEALCHLFFHCCLKDEVFKEPELDQIAAKIVGLGLRSELNVKEEVIHYVTYKPEVIDESEYLQHLANLIKPVNELALFSYCVELMLSDSSFELEEEVLTDKIASVLKIEESERDIVKKLMAQRKVVETDKLF
jgi:hypothetical protein